MAMAVEQDGASSAWSVIRLFLAGELMRTIRFKNDTRLRNKLFVSDAIAKRYTTFYEVRHSDDA